MSFDQFVVVAVILLLIVLLYKEWINPALSFFGAVVIFLLAGILTPEEALSGLSNQQVAVIFLLMLITSGIRLLYGDTFFFRIFHDRLSPKQFLFRMMATVSSVSAFLNNTPIVAFLIPHVRDWAERNKQPASKFLIPLSHATIAGGMITVIGTSTNLILQGLISQYHLPLLRFSDFLFLGLAVTVLVWLYYMVVGFRLLPAHTPGLETLKTNIKEYIVETEIFPGSPISGKSVKDAGLRNLKDLFLVEILRGTEVISPVSPDEVLAANDVLFFSGHTSSILGLIRDDNGLRLLKEDRLNAMGQLHFTEAVIPANSDLIGTRIRLSDFRNRYNASIIAIHRNGKRVSGKVGETVLAGGDFLLLLTGEAYQTYRDERNLYLISPPVKIKTRKPWWQNLLGLFVLAGLMSGILGALPLFTACLVLLAALVGLRILSVTEIRRQIDLSLLTVLVSSLAIGTALVKSGAANLLASWILNVGIGWGIYPVLVVLFVTTTVVTSLVTNAATVAIMFPIALSLSQLMGMEGTPFFVTIAFAASGDFITPIGYQTNLMVYGPGGYSFRDFFKVGLPLTLLYMITCISFIAWYYHPGA